jgi:DME family drug/metabolite transporter
LILCSVSVFGAPRFRDLAFSPLVAGAIFMFMRSRARGGVGFLVMSGLLWGTGGLTGTVLERVAGLPAVSVAAYRLLVGGSLLAGYLLARGRLPAGRRAWTRVIVIGLLAGEFQCCYFLAVSLTSVSLATLVTIGASPVIVGAVEAARGRGGGRRTTVITGLALAGLVLLVGVPGDGFGATAMLSSGALALLAAGGFSAVTLISARPVPGLDDLTVTGFGFTVGGVLLMALAAAVGRVGFAIDPATVGLVLALGIGPTAVAYTAYFRGLRGAPARTAALVSLLEPLTGTVLAVLLLGNRLGPAGIGGAGLLAVAVLLAARRGSQ